MFTATPSWVPIEPDREMGLEGHEAEVESAMQTTPVVTAWVRGREVLEARERRLRRTRRKGLLNFLIT